MLSQLELEDGLSYLLPPLIPVLFFSPGVSSSLYVISLPEAVIDEAFEVVNDQLEGLLGEQDPYSLQANLLLNHEFILLEGSSFSPRGGLPTSFFETKSWG